MDTGKTPIRALVSGLKLVGSVTDYTRKLPPGVTIATQSYGPLSHQDVGLPAPLQPIRRPNRTKPQSG
jgi:hypothetical protein